VHYLIKVEISKFLAISPMVHFTAYQCDVPELEKPIVKVVQELMKAKGPGSSRTSEWALEGGLLHFRGKVVVPKDKDLRRRIVDQHHNTRVAGHAGCWKTQELVSYNYWWPQMSRFTGQYVATCDLCAQTKILRQHALGELNPTEIPGGGRTSVLTSLLSCQRPMVMMWLWWWQTCLGSVLTLLNAIPQSLP
jgi:hypothetical protein